MNQLAIRGGASAKSKPFPSWPFYDEQDEINLIKALRSGCWGRCHMNQGAGNGAESSFIKQFEGQMCKRLDVKYAIAVSNGTSALEIAVRALDIKPGDEIIVTSYSYIASASCILQSGAIPVFADVDIGTWNICPRDIEKKITSRTKGIIVVHFAGQSADMDRIMKTAKQHNLYVIEDTAHGLGGQWMGKALGALGDISCFSFQESKNLTCGEGGLIATNNRELYEKAFSYHVTGRQLNGKWYEHHRLGWNARMTEFQGAVACSQLERFDEQQAVRNRNAEYLTEELSKIEGIALTEIHSGVTAHPYHIFTFRYDKSKWRNLSRSRFVRALNCEGIPCHIGYLYPIYKNPLFVQMVEKGEIQEIETCPAAEQICEESIWFPQNLLLGDQEDMTETVNAILKVRLNLDELGV